MLEKSARICHRGEEGLAQLAAEEKSKPAAPFHAKGCDTRTRRDAGRLFLLEMMAGPIAGELQAICESVPNRADRLL
jgi:hypothetical protein